MNNCHLIKEGDHSFSVFVSWKFIDNTIINVEQLGWKESDLHVYGTDKRSGKTGWFYIWDNVVVKIQGPFPEGQSYYGRKNMEMHTPEEAWEML